MIPVERFGPGWRRFSSALVAIKDTDPLFLFENPNELNVYAGEYPSAQIIASARIDNSGWATFRSVPEKNWLGSFTLFDSPQEVNKKIANFLARKTILSFEQWTRASNKVRACRDDMTRALGEQIQFCEIEAAGRIGSPLSEISLLAPDVWNFAEVIDWRRGVVRIADNEFIYSVHVRENDKTIQTDASNDRIGRLELRKAVYELLRVLDRGDLVTLTAKELMSKIEGKWKEHYPHKNLPSNDTVQRARDELIANLPNATDA